MRYDIIGIGYSTIDFLGIVPGYPAIDAKTEFVEASIQGGGVTATAMAAAARLGAKVSYVGVFGDDMFGRLALSEIDKEGIDTSHVVVRAGAESPFSFIVIDQPTGKRNIFWSRSGLEHLSPDELDKQHILSAKVLHIDNHEPKAALEAAKWANEAGITVLMDAGSIRPGVIDLLQHVDVLIASHRFCCECTGQDDPMTGAEAMSKGGRKISIVTHGEDGCACVTPDGSFHVPAFKVDVVDTTGAGDVFHGAFSFGIAKGWDACKTATFASAAAAIKCGSLGGRQGIPSFDETIAFLNENGMGEVVRTHLNAL